MFIPIVLCYSNSFVMVSTGFITYDTSLSASKLFS